jgi:hypothetical protein
MDIFVIDNDKFKEDLKESGFIVDDIYHDLSLHKNNNPDPIFYTYAAKKICDKQVDEE